MYASWSDKALKSAANSMSGGSVPLRPYERCGYPNDATKISSSGADTLIHVSLAEPRAAANRIGYSSNLLRPACTLGSLSMNCRAAASSATWSTANAEKFVGCDHRAIKKNYTCREVVMRIAHMVLHQELLFIRHVLGECRPRWDQLDEIRVFHGDAPPISSVEINRPNVKFKISSVYAASSQFAGS
jgi:hypothetical protein